MIRQTTGRHQVLHASVGNAIRAARRAAGLSVDDLAAQCEVNRSTIVNAEAGLGLSLHLFVSIAEALDTPLDALVPLEAT